MKLAMFALCAVMISLPALAEKKACDALKGDIDASLQKKGLKDYTLDIVDADKAGDAKVVGSCDGGTKKVVYARAKAESKAKDAK
jgi:hypothetical protein